MPCLACAVRERTFCGALRSGELDGLAATVSRTDYRARQTVVFEGAPKDVVYVVTTGVALMSHLLPDGSRRIYDFLYPGDCFGIDSWPTHDCDVETVTDLALCRFSRGQFDELRERYPRLYERIYEAIAEDLAASRRHLLLLAQSKARQRIASFLMTMAERAVRRGGDDKVIWLPMIRADIADFVGLTLETTSRAFAEFRRDGLIADLPGRRVMILDAEALERIANSS